MRITPSITISLLTVIAGAFALKYSSNLGRKVWSPEVFAWRNPLKPQPIIEEQANCPVRLFHPRFYSFMSIGSSIGSVLKIELKNISNKPIHSFSIRFYSLDPLDNGGGGYQLDTPLQSGESFTIGQSSRGTERVNVSIDFVLFADGSVWFRDPPSSDIKPEGVRAAEEAATEYLCEVLKLEGAEAVIKVLPNIRHKMGVWRFPSNEDDGSFSFDYGVKKAAVSVEHAYRKDGLSGVEKFFVRHD